jgi:hypothetical protein
MLGILSVGILRTGGAWERLTEKIGTLWAEILQTDM